MLYKRGRFTTSIYSQGDGSNEGEKETYCPLIDATIFLLLTRRQTTNKSLANNLVQHSELLYDDNNLVNANYFDPILCKSTRIIHIGMF